MIEAIRKILRDARRLQQTKLGERGIDHALPFVEQRIVAGLCVSNDEEFHEARL